jgi:hypothetical protein
MAVWQKVITSGSNAILNQLSVGTTQVITTSPSTTFLSGSFSGSFTGTAGGTLSNTLTFGPGISGSAVQSYNNTAAVTLALSGASALTTDKHVKWSGTGLVNSFISETLTQVTIATGSTISAGGLTVTGNTLFNNDLSVLGNLSVAGTASFYNTDNLNIRDKFILINSGSGNVFGDSGIIVQSGSAGSGSALFNKNAAGTTFGTYGRWAVAGDVVGTSTSVTADEFVVTAKVAASTAPGTTAPTWGGATNGSGNMWVKSDTGDIYIYA